MEDLAGEGVAGFDAVELGEDASPVGLVVEVGEQVEGFGDPTELGDGTPGRGGPTTPLQDPEDFAGADGAGGEAAGDAEQVVPGAGDEVGVDAVAGDPVQRAVVGVGVGAPEPGVAEVGQAGLNW